MDKCLKMPEPVIFTSQIMCIQKQYIKFFIPVIFHINHVYCCFDSINNIKYHK